MPVGSPGLPPPTTMGGRVVLSKQDPYAEVGVLAETVTTSGGNSRRSAPLGTAVAD